MIQWSYFPASARHIFTDDEVFIGRDQARDLRRWMAGPDHAMGLTYEKGTERFRWVMAIWSTGSAPGLPVRHFRAARCQQGYEILGPEVDAAGNKIAPPPCVTVMSMAAKRAA